MNLLFRRLIVLSLAGLISMPGYSSQRPDNRMSVDQDLAADSMQICREEGSRAAISAWIWGLTGAGLAAYAINAFAGGHGSDSGLKYFAAIGALGSSGGCWNALVHRDEMYSLRSAMASDIQSSEPDTAFTRETVRRVGTEFRVMHASLISASAGSIRAGCIMPVLLSGMGIFGFSMGGSAGADLAGVSMAGALGIGAPSMLYYINIKRDLDRMDALMPRWNESFREKKKEGLAQ